MIKLKSIYAVDSTEPEEVSTTNRKIYMSVIINKMRVIGCLDSGSDVTILQQSQFKQLFKQNLDLENSDVSQIVTFSDDSVKILGIKKVLLKLSKDHRGFMVTLYIIPDIPNVPLLLLGNDTLQSGLGAIAYYGNPKDPKPHVTFNYPTYHESNIYFVTPKELNRCYGMVDLEPFETKEVELYLEPAAQVLRTDYVLVTSLYWDIVNVIPTRSELEFV